MPKNNTDDGYVGRGDFVYRHKIVPTFVSAHGPFLEDNNGFKYFDAEAANGTASLGFDYSILKEATEKINKIPGIPSFCETEIRLKVAKKIVKKIKKITGLDGQVSFELGGAQGVELALMIAKSNNPKSQFVVFEGGYHGRSIFTSQLSASHRYRSLMGDWRVPIVRLPYPDFEQYDSLSSSELKKIFITYIKKITVSETGGIITRKGQPDISALIIEPLLNAGGIVKPDRKFLEEIIKIFRNLGALIIVDEIFCGFHRTGPMFGFQHYNFVPDIIIMSKALTNGINPLSCVWARKPYLEQNNFPPGTHSATFINSPLALSIADNVLDRFKNWKNIATDIKKLEKELKDTINKIVKFSKLAKSGYALGGVGRILLKNNNAGDILNIALDVAKNKPFNGVHGLVLASTSMAPNVVAINPPLNLTKEEVKILSRLLINTFKKAEGVVK